MRRTHLFTAWLAIVALLFDGLLPTAVSAATTADILPQLALCSTAKENTLPGQSQPNSPPRHCALCAICTGCVLGLLPSREGGHFVRRLAGAAGLAVPRSMKSGAGRFEYASAQPRAPPQPTS